MATIYLAESERCTSDWHRYPLLRLRESAEQSRTARHRLTDDPEAADVILFAHNHTYFPLGLGLFGESLFLRYRRKCFLFDSSDDPSPLVGGLCASWPQSTRHSAPAVGWCYHHPNAAEPYVEAAPPETPYKYLWSFKGSSETHPLRDRIFKLSDPDAYLEDTSQGTMEHLMGKSSESDQTSFRTNYIELLYASKFVLCPRGVGPSSMRIFEAMRAGRAPVILSDDWSPPPFIDWEKVSLRIAEADYEQLPRFLREHEAQAAQMGAAARSEWERVLGPEGLFDYTVDACLQMIEQAQQLSTISKLKRARHLVHPVHRRKIPRWVKQRLKRR